MILYADDIVIFANDSSELQSSLDVLLEYYQRWKLKVNIETTKIMVFRKGGRLSQNLRFLYDGKEIEIVSKFNYLGIVFSSGGSFSEAQHTLCRSSFKSNIQNE